MDKSIKHNIVTYGASPYIKSKMGRIHSDLLNKLYVSGHYLNAICWHHDISYYLPDSLGKYYYNFGDKNICEVFPVNRQRHVNSQLSIDMYNTIDRIKPEYVIAIGDYDEIMEICAIKEINNSFILIGILVIDGLPIPKKYYDILDKFDYIITINEKSYNFINNNLSDIDVEYGKIDINNNIFYNNGNRDKLNTFNILGCLKNSQICNPAAFIKAVGDFSEGKDDVIAYLHTNYNDPGEYDVNELLYRFDKKGIISLPKKYSSVVDNIDDIELNNLYNNYNVIIDPSVSSATSMHITEAVMTGCIPICMLHSSLLEYMKDIDYKYIINSVLYVGNNQEDLYIASVDSIVTHLENIYFIWKNHCDLYRQISKSYSELFKKDSKRNIYDIIESYIENKNNKKKGVKLELMNM